jgi:uncharacterized protein YkwD
MKKLFIFLLTFSFMGVYAYDRNDVDKAYSYLSKNWVYYTSKGVETKVKSLKKGCKGNNCYLTINGKKRDPKKIFSISKGQLVSVVDGSSGGKAPENTTDNSTNNPPSNLQGDEPGVFKGMTEAHNVYRKKTGVPDVVWDSTLASYAQEWANHLKSTKNCGMQHRSSNKYGENLAWASGMNLNPNSIVKMWYDEIKDYNYANNSCRSVCGHYTQVVWKSSKKIGCGMAKCGSAEVWVCNYDPPGNYVGQKPY